MTICALQNFLRDLLKEAKRSNDVSENKLIEYTDIMVRNVDGMAVSTLIDDPLDSRRDSLR